MQLQPLQAGFKAGQITPRLFGDPGAPVYRNGVSELLNMIALAQGPAISRGGSVYVGEAGNDVAIRLIPFNVARGQDYLIEFGPGYLRIYNDDGLVPIGGQELIKDPFFINEFNFWTDTSTGSAAVTFDHNLRQAILTNGNGAADAGIEQRMRDIDAGDLSEPHTLSGTFSGNGALRIEIGTTQGASDVLDQLVVAVGDFSIALNPASTVNWIRFTNEGANGSVANLSAPRFSNDVSTDFLVTPYQANDLPRLQHEMISSVGTLIVAHSLYPTKTMTLVGATDFQFLDAAFVNPPTQWAPGNYPGVITVFQGRLWLARTTNELQTFWASKSGSYLDFDKGSAAADDSLEFELAAPGEIEWMRGQKDLLMGTDLGEYRIDSQSGIITPGDIDIRQQSAYGSAELIQAQNIGDQVLYVSPDRSKVRALTFDAFQQGWYSPDLTWTSNNITAGGIKEIHFARDPATLILCVLKTGGIAVCTYDRSQETLGWSFVEFTDATVESVGITNNENGSQIWLAVRQSNGVMVILGNPLALGINVHMDSSITRPVEVGDIVTGLDHLEGITVSVVLDGAVHPPRLVTGGQIALDYTGVTAVVGVGFTARLTTLPLGMPSRSGTGLAEIKHYGKIYVRLINSAIPKVNGVRSPTRTPSTPMGLPEPVNTKDVQTTPLGRDRLGIIEVEQDLPLRLEILNIFGEVGQYSL